MSWRISVVRSGVGTREYRAAVQSDHRKSFADFIKHAEKATTVSSADIKAVVEQMAVWILTCAESGDTCDLHDLGGSVLGVKGGFDTHPRELRRDDIELTISWILSPRIRDAVRKMTRSVKVEIVEAKPRDPVVDHVETLMGSSSWMKNVWKAGRTLHVSGINLKFDAQREDEGVFLISTSTGEAVRMPLYHDLFPKHVKCVVPENLEGSGEMELELRRRRRPSDQQVRIGKYDYALTEA